ncbi:histidine phosphatase family protein [Agromyces sp. MMS24-K17]|uniref:histidine phosphatase family protein n=1 Tax=Agromyces sp. MMS24-K17 TaxID=3372850 RepID=UPI003754A24C
MTTRILLVRHGETDWNVAGRIQGRTDIPLNDTGRAQARGAAAAIASAPDASEIARVVSSPFARAADTAAPIADALGLPVDLDDAFAEQAFGAAEGITWVELHRRWPDGYPGVETRPEVVARVTEALERVAVPDATTLVVTHGGVINALNVVLSARPEDYPGHAANVSVHEFALDADGLRRADPRDAEQVA